MIRKEVPPIIDMSMRISSGKSNINNVTISK